MGITCLLGGACTWDRLALFTRTIVFPCPDYSCFLQALSGVTVGIGTGQLV
jgi:hypothetical protein